MQHLPGQGSTAEEEDEDDASGGKKRREEKVIVSFVDKSENGMKDK